MAAATAAAAAVILFLFTFSSAYSPLDQPKNDILSTDSNPKPGAAILLPSDRTESEAATLPEETDSKEERSVSVSDSQTDSLPLTATVLTLRPVNRRFFRLPLFPIRRGFKCHGHHRRHHIHQLKQRFAGQREISFGNDMIVAKSQDRGFEPANSGDGQIRERWAKYNHGGERFSLNNDDTIRQEMYRLSHARPHFHHHHHHRRHGRHHRDEDEEEEEEENRHDHERGIMSSIRKFLHF